MVLHMVKLDLKSDSPNMNIQLQLEVEGVVLRHIQKMRNSLVRRTTTGYKIPLHQENY